MTNFNINSAKELINKVFAAAYDYAQALDTTLDARQYLEIHWGYAETSRFMNRIENKYSF